MPIQTTDNFELESLVQDVLSSRPEYLKQFAKLMDEKDVWGNGWERFEEYSLQVPVETTAVLYWLLLIKLLLAKV